MNLAIVLLFLMVLAVSVLLTVTPLLMPATECFTVSVPHGSRSQEPLNGLMRTYMLQIGAICVLCLLAWPLTFAIAKIDLNAQAGVWQFTVLMTVTLLVPLFASFVLMLHFRRRVQALKRERGWHASHPQAAAFVGPEDFPQPLSLTWNLSYLLLIAGMVIFALANYEAFPEQIPMSINFDGSVTAYEPKSVITVLFPALLTTFMGIVFTGTHWGIKESKKPVDPEAPASSALAYAHFARVQSIVQLVGGLGISALTGISFYASSLGMLPMSSCVLIVLVGTLAYVAVVMILSLALGQSGARIAAEVPGSGMGADDDAHWLLGSIYFNPQDPSIFVPKRFGIGWTTNAGRWESWALVAALVAITVVFVLITTSFGN